jgi:ABC-2 type transport system permease protein
MTQYKEVIQSPFTFWRCGTGHSHMSLSTLQTFQARYRYSFILLKQLVKTDFKLRYQGSALGYLWSLLRPLAIFLIMYVVFLRFLKFDFQVPHSTVYLLLGIVLWSFFTEVTSNGVSAIVGKGDLLRKINFPKYVIVFAVSFSALINLALNLLVVAAFMIADGVKITPSILWVIPLVLELFVLGLAVAFILSAVFVKLRDVNYIWDVVMQGLFYAIPIFYPLYMVPEKAVKLMLLNPIAQIVQDMRHVIVTPQTTTVGAVWHSGLIRFIPVTIVVMIALFSVYYFRKHSRSFAEEI